MQCKYEHISCCWSGGNPRNPVKIGRIYKTQTEIYCGQVSLGCQKPANMPHTQKNGISQRMSIYSKWKSLELDSTYIHKVNPLCGQLIATNKWMLFVLLSAVIVRSWPAGATCSHHDTQTVCRVISICVSCTAVTPTQETLQHTQLFPLSSLGPYYTSYTEDVSN